MAWVRGEDGVWDGVGEALGWPVHGLTLKTTKMGGVLQILLCGGLVLVEI